MTKLLRAAFIITLLLGWGSSFAQCNINTADSVVGFSPGSPAVVQPGLAYSQTAEVYVPKVYGSYTVDSLHIDSISGMPSGFTYVLNPASGTVMGGTQGVICYSGTTYDTVGPYPLTFYGDIYTNGGAIPFSYLVTLAPSFGYKFRVETHPIAAFMVDSPVCSISDSVKFVDLTGGYPTGWAWTFTGGSPATSNHQFPVVYYDSAGTYNVRLIARNGIAHDTLNQTITVYPSLSGTVAITPATSDSSLTGSATVTTTGGTPPLAFTWSNGATTESITNVVEGAYQVGITDAKGCQYINDSVNITFVNGILQLSNGQQLKIYPNPATDVLNLDWCQESNAEISIIDLKGDVIRTFISNGVTANVYDIHDLAAGTYVIRVNDKSSNTSQAVLFSKL